MFEGFKKMLGGETGPKHYEDSDAPRTGIKAEGFTHDISSSLEGIDYDVIKAAIPDIFKDLNSKFGLPIGEMPENHGLFMKELQSRGIVTITEPDTRFRTASDVVKKAVLAVSTEMADAQFQAATKDQLPKATTYRDVA